MMRPRTPNAPPPPPAVRPAAPPAPVPPPAPTEPETPQAKAAERKGTPDVVVATIQARRKEIAAEDARLAAALKALTE